MGTTGINIEDPYKSALRSVRVDLPYDHCVFPTYRSGCLESITRLCTWFLGHHWNLGPRMVYQWIVVVPTCRSNLSLSLGLVGGVSTFSNENCRLVRFWVRWFFRFNVSIASTWWGPRPLKSRPFTEGLLSEFPVPLGGSDFWGTWASLFLKMGA